MLVTSNTLQGDCRVHVPRMLGEFLLTVCFALGCVVFGCGVVYLAAKIQRHRQDAAEDMSR